MAKKRVIKPLRSILETVQRERGQAAVRLTLRRMLREEVLTTEAADAVRAALEDERALDAVLEEMRDVSAATSEGDFPRFLKQGGGELLKEALKILWDHRQEILALIMILMRV